MRIARVMNDGNEEYGIVKNNQWFHIPEFRRNDMGIENFLVNPDMINNIDLTDAPHDIDKIQWLSPIARPGKIICVGRNYLKHAQEQGKDAESKPLLFTNPQNVSGTG